MLSLLKNIINRLSIKVKTKYARREISKFKKVIPISCIKKTFNTRNEEYEYFNHFFWNLSPQWLKDHRDYFRNENRGFGEDAFHAMWYFIFTEFKPKKVLEIGVYRGQTISLFMLLAEKLNCTSEIHGISPFTSSGDEVSKYLDDFDYLNDVKNNFDFFNLKHPLLHKGFSNEGSMLELIKSNKWDLIYIDGNHDYEVAKSDFQNCTEALNVGGIIVLDDSALYTNYSPSFNSTSGHPGPSQVADEIDLSKFTEILSVGHNRVFLKLK